MSTPQEHVQRVQDLLARIKNHPMCFALECGRQSATVVFPTGDFAVDGVRTSFGAGKAVALEHMLDVMERMWRESFPGYRA